MSRYATINPATGETVEEFDTISGDEVEQALASSAEAYRGWRDTPLEERSAVLMRVADLYRQRSEDLARLMTLEMGKPVGQARGEIELSASIFEYYATKGPELLEDEELDIAGSGRAVVRTAPIGPLLGVMPWNFPHYQVARFVAPNLLLGNTILLKHAGSCPQQALRIADMISESGAPAGVYQNVFASNEQVAGMIADPRLHGVSLTGSERAGSIIGGLAGQHMKKAVLELGGSDPFIVLADADVDAAVAAGVPARFGNAGQTCTSSKRFIVASDVYDEFVEKFVAQASAWVMGDPNDESTRLGPMASVGARDDVAAQVEDAVSKGAKAHAGGQVPDGAGAYYPATVLTDLEPSMRAYREELFGPVAMVHRVDSVDAAIDLANDSPFGLGSAVFTQDGDHAAYVADRLEVGMVGLNTTVKSAPDLPFGGVKSSGIGRELGRFGLDEFSNKKLVRHV
ncbi:NAD-dependent succinate-semialdehyde dehydrogenase [Aeromicrobium sp. CF4.19]|uniref:NAD-dependent succinate-semialdehyde dehydrogenase n=1 Tax=Aeromicrobium sp. CF4.19 TaxID=3373082 RepID=UPI003EE4FD1D